MRRRFFVNARVATLLGLLIDLFRSPRRQSQGPRRASISGEASLPHESVQVVERAIRRGDAELLADVTE
jgi:hypothetical protein